MADTIIAKIKLTPLTPYWKDMLNHFSLEKDMIYPITDNMILDSIREGIEKGYIYIVEGKLPIDESDVKDGLTVGQVEEMINDAVDNIKHPECNITVEEKEDILNRIKHLEDGTSTTDPDNPVTPDPDPGEDTPSTGDKFGTYEWKEEYTFPAATNIVDITGSKLIEEYNADPDAFYDQYYLAGKYEVYAPRLASHSGVPTTADEDLVDTLIPLGLTDSEWLGEKQVEGADLSKVSVGLVGMSWIYNDASDETLNQLEFDSAATTPVIIYLIKRP